MKQIAAGIVLLALTTPAFAGGAAAEWDCGKYKVVSDKGWLGVGMYRLPRDREPAEAEMAAAAKGKITFTWDFRGARENLVVNGVRCKRTQ